MLPPSIALVPDPELALTSFGDDDSRSLSAAEAADQIDLSFLLSFEGDGEGDWKVLAKGELEPANAANPRGGRCGG